MIFYTGSRISVGFFLLIINHLHYDSLQLSAQKKESGELSILLKIGLPVNLISWMEIYEYHVKHPKLSQFQVALHFNTSKFKVYRAYLFMNQVIN